MIQTYLSYNFTISPLKPIREILIAELANVGFESFENTSTGIKAYIPKNDWKNSILDTIYILKNSEFDIQFHIEEVEPINWNKKWENNFEPIEIDETVSIRAPFHEKGNLKYNLLIEPKMSFGTGHHETTHLMVQQLLELDLKGKKVLDMGCGTAVLALLAEMLGATTIDAIDIDPWSYENSLENIAKNNSRYIKIYQGDASLLVNKKYNVIIANINRNILLQDMASYVASLSENAILLLSGFYIEDIPIIEKEAVKYGLKKENVLKRNNWVSLRFSL